MKPLGQRIKLIRCREPHYWQLRLGPLWITRFHRDERRLTVWAGSWKRLWPPVRKSA